MPPSHASVHVPSLVLGLAIGGLIVATLRREARRPHAEAPRRGGHVIDGARPPARAELDARPAPESSASTTRLVSEALDVDPRSQRWGPPA
jgi:hypothetical protein